MFKQGDPLKKKQKVFVAIAVIIGLCVVAIASTTIDWDELPRTTGRAKYDYLGGAYLALHRMNETYYNNVTGDYRPLYENLSDKEYEWIFGNLPSFPQDFFSVVKLVYEGKVADYDRIAEEYWMQPEFYVGWFNTYSTSYPRNRPDMWAVEGWSFFPILKEVIAKKGSTIVTTCYLRSGYGIETYQGLIIHPYLPESAKNIYGKVLFNQSGLASSYIKPRITNPDDVLYDSFKNSLDYSNVGDSDWMLIFEPTYSIVRDKYGEFMQYTGFPSNWVYLVYLEVEISEDTPSGDYVVAFQVDPPCFEINQEYYYAKDHEYFGSYYYPVSQIARSNKPVYQLIVRVE